MKLPHALRADGVAQGPTVGMSSALCHGRSTRASPSLSLMIDEKHASSSLSGMIDENRG